MVHGGTCQGGSVMGSQVRTPPPPPGCSVGMPPPTPISTCYSPPPPPQSPIQKHPAVLEQSGPNLHPPPPTPLPYSPNHSTVAPGLRVIKAVVRGIGEKCVLFNQPIRNGFIPQTANQNQILFSIREGFISQSTNQRRFYPAAVRVPGGHGN